MANSEFIQLNDYVLIEYIYNDIVYTTSEIGFRKIDNNYDNTIHLTNLDNALNLTGNVRDKSVSQLNSMNQFVLHNIDVPVLYTNFDSNITDTNLDGIIGAYNIQHDTIKFHILSGYNFDDLEGLIFQIRCLDNTRNDILLANIAQLKSDSNLLKFNTTPLFLGDRYYDKYVELQIPSIDWINDNFYTQTTNTNTLGYNYSNSNSGLKLDTLIYIKVFEIESTTKNGNYLYLNTNNSYDSTFTQIQRYALLGVTIEESDTGDYFEYYGTFDDAFLEDYISELNSLGGNWVVIHQLEIFEQLDIDFVKTATITSLQETNFDRPELYRPIITNADRAFSFTIDYTMRFTNTINGEAITRKASITSTEPKKYGRELQRINVNSGFQPVKVYNIVNDEAKFELPTLLNEVTSSVQYIPTFFDLNNVIITNSNYIINNSNRLVPNYKNDIYFGQNKAIIFLSNFDSYIKFNIFRIDENSNLPISINLEANSQYFLTFILKNKTTYIEDLESENNLSQGEIMFRITKLNSEKLLLENNKKFKIISKSDSGQETVIYAGSYDNIDNISSYNDYFEEIRKSQTEILEADSQTANETPLVITELDENQLVIQNKIKTQEEVVKEKLINKSNLKENINIVEIPGRETNIYNSSNQFFRPNRENNS